MVEDSCDLILVTCVAVGSAGMQKVLCAVCNIIWRIRGIWRMPVSGGYHEREVRHVVAHEVKRGGTCEVVQVNG